MNRRWMLPLLLGVAVATVAYLATPRLLCPRNGDPADRLQDLAFLTRELRLTPEQVERLRQMHAGLNGQLDDCCRRHCAARAALTAALADETNTPARAEAQLAEMVRAYEASERATLDHIRQVRAALTPEQRKRFDALLNDGLCRSCSMPGGKHSTDHRP